MPLQIPDLTPEELQVREVDLSMVAICKKIRRLANLDRLRLDTSTHHSGLNKHLLDYITYCGLDALEFVKGYLANLQPYMLTRKQEQEKKAGYLCILDNAYRVSVYIKIDTTEGEEMVVSFHEDNKKGIAKGNQLIQYSNILNHVEYVAVFVNNCVSYSAETHDAVVDVLVQRGLKVVPVTIAGRKYKDVFIVRRQAIDTVLMEYCNSYLSDLYTSTLALDYSKVNVFTALQQLSFTSYGRNIFETFSLLIDSLCVQSDVVSRTIADFAIVTYAKSVQLTVENKKQLVDMLRERYAVSSVRAMPTILDRIATEIP